MANLYNPDYLKQLCQRYKLRPSKKYGQNFLINPEPIQRIVAAAELSEKDTIVEVGPGFGVLTLAMVDKVEKVVAYEIERKLKEYWENISSQLQTSKLEIVWGNVLNAPRPPSVVNYKVVANLPYQITSNLIRKFLEADQPPKLMVLMVQAQVAERICAQPGQMSLLSVAVQYYAKPEIITKVPKTYFWPQPKVDSAIIRLNVNKIRNSKISSQEFFKLVKAGFASRRKLLINNLISLFGQNEPLLAPRGEVSGLTAFGLPLRGKPRGILSALARKNNPPTGGCFSLASLDNEKDKISRVFRKIGLPEQARAQELSIDQWVKLAADIADIYEAVE